METPLTPLEFARRARKLYPGRVAVIDGDSRWTYAQFLDRCDRWSAVLQKLGIDPGDRVAYLSPNSHAQLESFYAVPQIGAVLVPLNYRLTADDFVYLINHSGSCMLNEPAGITTISGHSGQSRNTVPGFAAATSLTCGSSACPAGPATMQADSNKTASNICF